MRLLNNDSETPTELTDTHQEERHGVAGRGHQDSRSTDDSLLKGLAESAAGSATGSDAENTFAQ